VNRFWNRNGEEGELEARLRAARPQPREEFVSGLAARVRSDRVRARGRSFRLGFAGVLTAAMLVSLAAFGGLGYAASGVAQVAHAVTHVFSPASARNAFGGGDRKDGKGKETKGGGKGSGDNGKGSGNNQYEEDHHFGDDQDNHEGKPKVKRRGGEFAPPLTPSCKGSICTLSTDVTIDEQAHVTLSVLIAGKEIPIIQSGSKFGGKLKGVAAKNVNYLVLIPGTRTMQLNLPKGSLPAGSKGQIQIIARDPQGNKTTFSVPFTA
jgi:hypothetical protein